MIHFSELDAEWNPHRPVAVFPLPEVVLFPRAVLPLHIFEPRYKQMTADALSSDGLIALALLKDGYQEDYHEAPAFHEVLCVGRVVAYERLGGGEYNLLLQGVARGRVGELVREQPYRELYTG